MSEFDPGTHNHDLLRDLVPQTRALRELIPDVYAGYSQTARAAFEDGFLPRKYKELMALSIAVVDQCDGCIASHSSGAARAGATREEAAEAIGVAIAMRGGPATIYGPRAFAAFLEWEQPRSDAGGS